MDLKKTIMELGQLPAPSGYEMSAAERIEQLLKPLVDETRIDIMGNVTGVRRCGRENAPKLLLDAHMDEVGFVVTETAEGFLKFSTVGGVDPRMLPGREVKILADEPELKSDISSVINDEKTSRIACVASSFFMVDSTSP